MPRPRVVVFDLGKVLLDFDYGRAARQLARRGQTTERAIRELIDQSPLLHQLESGRITSEEFFQRVREATGYSQDFTTFAREFGDIFEPMPEMIELHRRISGAGHATFIFSNTNDLAVTHIRHHYPFFSGFTGHVFSYAHRSMKPEAALYRVVEELARAQGPEILYIDDRAENVEAGTARGWQTILQTTPASTRARVQAMGLLPGS